MSSSGAKHAAQEAVYDDTFRKLNMVTKDVRLAGDAHLKCYHRGCCPLASTLWIATGFFSIEV